MNEKERFDYFSDLISCEKNLYSWTYHANGDLISTNCPDMVLNRIFKEVGCMDALQNYVTYGTKPVLLSSLYGFQWGATLQKNASGENLLYCVGPVFHMAFSSLGIQEVLRKANVPLDYRRTLEGLLESLPCIPQSYFLSYIAMLHYVVAEERVEKSEIIPISTQPLESAYYKELKKHLQPLEKTMNPTSTERRRLVYELEQRILNHIRTGNLNYAKELDHAALTNAGITAYEMKNPLLQTQSYGITFVTLCSRAGIEGGLSPDIAYSMGDEFLHRIHNAKTNVEIKEILDQMYDSYIRKVHDLKNADICSPQIRSILEYIESYPENDLSAPTLAARIGYVKEHLSRKFKEETGETLTSYIRKVRIARAKHLLATTSMKISEIADCLQFSSGSHFSGVFQKETGMLPGEYREQTLKI